MENSLSLADIKFKTYEKEAELHEIIKLVENELSEPYSIFTYRYFLQKWPHLCILAYYGDKMIGSILGKLDARPNKAQREGYIAMLVVDKAYRKLKIGSKLVSAFIEECRNCGGDEVVLETEVVNIPALKLYESLGFARDKRLQNYYMNGNDAYRLKFWLRLERLVPRLFEKEKEPEDQEKK